MRAHAALHLIMPTAYLVRRILMQRCGRPTGIRDLPCDYTAVMMHRPFEALILPARTRRHPQVWQCWSAACAGRGAACAAIYPALAPSAAGAHCASVPQVARRQNACQGTHPRVEAGLAVPAALVALNDWQHIFPPLAGVACQLLAPAWRSPILLILTAAAATVTFLLSRSFPVWCSVCIAIPDGSDSFAGIICDRHWLASLIMQLCQHVLQRVIYSLASCTEQALGHGQLTQS